jgi:hypothetical protein
VYKIHEHAFRDLVDDHIGPLDLDQCLEGSRADDPVNEDHACKTIDEKRPHQLTEGVLDDDGTRELLAVALGHGQDTRGQCGAMARQRRLGQQFVAIAGS